MPNGCVTSTSYLRSHQEKTHTSQHLGWDTKCQKMSDMRVDRSLQKKMEKNNKSARTHPAYRQSWDTLTACPSFADAGCVRVDLLFFSFGGKDQHAWHFRRTCPHIGPKLACRAFGMGARRVARTHFVGHLPPPARPPRPRNRG